MKTIVTIASSTILFVFFLVVFKVVKYGELISLQLRNTDNSDVRMVLGTAIEQEKDFRCWNMSAAFGSEYAKALYNVHEETNRHNSYLVSLLKTKTAAQRARCYEGHVGRYAEEAYVYWELAKLDFVKVICETGTY